MNAKQARFEKTAHTHLTALLSFSQDMGHYVDLIITRVRLMANGAYLVQYKVNGRKGATFISAKVFNRSPSAAVATSRSLGMFMFKSGSTSGRFHRTVGDHLVKVVRHLREETSALIKVMALATAVNSLPWSNCGSHGTILDAWVSWAERTLDVTIRLPR